MTIDQLFAGIPVIDPVLVAIIVVLVGALGVLLTLTRGQRKFAIFAALAIVLAVGVFFVGPQISPPPKGSPVSDYGGVYKFKTRYDQNRSFYGETIGDCGMRQGPLTCYFTYGFMVAHPEIKDSYWQIQLDNLGTLLMKHRGIPEVANPVVPPVVANFITSQQNAGVDIVYFYGYPRTNPIRDGDRFVQFWDKTEISWPASSLDGTEDPAAVKREPVGTIMWNIENRGIDPAKPDPWTPARRLLVAVAGFCLLVSALPWAVPGLRQSSYGGMDF